MGLEANWWLLNIVQVGKLTSYTTGRKQSEHFGLGYIKRNAASEGDNVVVGDNINGTVAEVPFLAMQRQPWGRSNWEIHIYWEHARSFIQQ